MRPPGARLGFAVVFAVLLAGAPPASARSSSASDQVLHLLNAARARHEALPLRQDGLLALAARRHSRDMVRHHYFAHDSRTGVRFAARIARTGWMRSRRRWSVGETLAWGAGVKSRPRSIVAAWLASPEHRRIVLSRSFRLVGIGVAPAAPFGAGRTFTADFGSP